MIALNRGSLALAVSAGVAAGIAFGWWYAKPPTPWMHFTSLRAIYALGTEDILLRGGIFVDQECAKGVIWRTEAVATDGQIALYDEKPGMPELTDGYHAYKSSIPLLEEISPDGWVVRIIVTCPGEDPETVTGAATVVVVDGGPP